MKIKIKTNLVLVIVLIWSISLIFALVSAKSPSETKEGKIIISEPTQTGSFFIAANLSHENDINQNEIVSNVLRADFPFNAIYAHWSFKDPSQNTNFQLYTRFLNENWTDWQKTEIDDDVQGKDNSNFDFYSQLIPTKITDSFEYKLIFASEADKNNFNHLEFIYLDTTHGPNGYYKISTQANNDLPIITRQEWGADEGLGYDQNNNDLWPEDYYTPKKFIIHHTAGEKANENPLAYIRAIQYYHAKTRDWGDIGYNYLIDSKGNIYEGRKGGDGVVGGHAYLNNQNSIGIAILGCYEDGSSGQKNSTCNTPTQLTEETKVALAKLIAKKSQEFNIDPIGTSEFKGKMLPNIIGHRDVGNTTCPGNLIYDALPKIRELAAADLADLGGFKKPLPTSAEFVNLSTKEIKIEETKTADVFAEFKNTGQETWRGYEDNYLYISGANLKNKIARIDSIKIALESDKDQDQTNTSAANQSVYKLIAGNVYPNEIGKFKLVLTPPTDKVSLTENYTLAWLNKGYFPNTDFSIAVTKIPCQSCLNQNTNPTPLNQATLASSDLPEQIMAENTIPVKIVLTNTGNQIWDKDKLKLKIVYEHTNISPFKNNSWFDEYASIPPAEKTILPQANATFEFKLKAPALLTTFPHTFTLNYDGQEIWQLDKTLEVISPYSAQITKNTLPQSAKPNSRPKVTLTFKNTGTKDWTLPALKSYDLDNTNSWFKDWSWLDSKTVKKVKKTIKPGEEIEFNFRLLAYWKQDTYPQVFRLFSGKNQIYLAGQKELIMKTKVTK